MPTPTHEPGGGLPSLGALYSETLTDLTENLQGYAMAGLAFMAIVMPVSMIGGIVAMVLMQAVLFLGLAASAVGSAALADATGAGGPVMMLGSFGSVLVAIASSFAVITLMVGFLAPVSASVSRAIAAHQRGEAPLTFGGALGTMTQDPMAAMATLLLVTGGAFVGMLFCYVGALVPAILFGFAFTMVSLHRKGVMDALRISAKHAMARPAEHAAYALAYMATAMVAGSVPVLGHMFLMALGVRAYRKMFGDGAEPVL